MGREREARPDRVVAVLGMHRSGTSALAGSLEQRGLFLGDASTANRYNPRGNRENRRVVELNVAVLRNSGGSWREPPDTVRWSGAHLDEGRQILAEHSGRPVWGFKDPRTLLTVEGWQELVPDVEFVGIFRDPARVARSLASRPQLQVRDPVSLWRAYNERLLTLHRRRPFPILSFDDDGETLEGNLARAATALGLGPAAGGESFFSAELRGEEAQGIELPPDVRALYEELQGLAMRAD